MLSKTALYLYLLALFGCNVLLGGCDLSAIAPTPPPTPIPTITPSPEPAATITPTLGPREFIDAVYCWESPIDVGEFNLLRFFADGLVLDATVQPFATCEEAWSEMAAYIIPDRTMDFGHGEYFMSGDIIRFELAAPHSEKIVGDAFGEFDGNGDRLVLIKGGATQEYQLIR